MPIRYQCQCGATIRLPDHAVGRRARCQTCKTTFTVPAGPAWPENLDVHAQPIAGPTPKPAEPATTPRLPGGRDDTQDWISKPVRPFWRDLPASFALCFEPGNFVTLLIIAFLHFWLVLLNFGGLFGLIGMIIVYGYLCAFYQLIILETASGEDELPNMPVRNIWDDVLIPLVRFVATWLVALAPVIAVNLAVRAWDLTVPPWLSPALVLLGCAFWPVIILAVSIGGGFGGLWPHVIVRTALAAPVAYVAIVVTLALAVGLTLLPDMLLPASWLGQSFWALHTLNAVVTAYASIVAMKAIGLYYRHYKHKFPWVAE